MTFNLNLEHRYFVSIKEGQKDIEMRLYNEKRRQISIHDHILFSDNSTKETLEVEVIGIHVYKDFFELYKHFEKTRLGYYEDEEPNPKDMNVFYKEKDINKYGVVGFEIRLL